MAEARSATTGGHVVCRVARLGYRWQLDGSFGPRFSRVPAGKSGQKIRVTAQSYAARFSMRALALSIFLVLALAARETRAATAEKSSWQAQWDSAVAGAKKEGAVYLWGDMEITHPDIIAAFTKEFPFIKPITVTGRVGDLTMRILAERRAGKYLADLYSGVMGGAAFYEFYRTGVLDSVKAKFILPEVTDESKWLGGKHHYV